MKPVRLALVLGLFVGVALAFAAPTAGNNIMGTSPQTLTLSEDAQILLQCPGQIIQFRGMNPTDVHDAGTHDIRVDFIANPDAIGLGLTGIQTKLGLRNADGGTLNCDYAR